MATERFSMSEAVRFGWDTVTSNFGYFLGLSLLVILISGVPGIMKYITASDSYFINTLFEIGSQVIGLFLGMGMLHIALRFADGKQSDIGHLLSFRPVFFKYLLGSIMYGLIVAVGLVLLIVPGIIWGIQFQYFAYFIIDEGLDPVKALKRSSEITRGAKGDLFLYALLILGINILGFLALLVGMFITVPLSLVASAWVFRKLSQSPAVAPTEPHPAGH